MPLVASETEAARLAALRRYHILDTPAEEVFDEITALAAHICETPIALISLVEDVRQWFKSKVGLAADETPRSVSFCSYAIEHPERLFMVENATEDARFAANPLVTAAPHIRFYTGAPLVTPDGYALGTLCVIDRVPRGLRPDQQTALRILARQVSTQLELRRQLAAQEQALAERLRTEDILRASETRYRALFDHNLYAVLLSAANGAILEANPAACALFGYTAEEFRALTQQDLIDQTDARGAVRTDSQQQGRLPTEVRLICRDGTRFPAEIAYVIFRDQQGLEISAMLIRDMTERMRANTALAQRAQLAALGADVGVALTQPEATEGILQRCAEALVQHLQAAFARIWTLNEADNKLELRASAGMYTHLNGPHSRVPMGQFKIGLIAAERQPHLTNAVVGDPRVSDQAWAQREGMVAFAGYPLIVDNRLVGVMALFARQPLPDTTLDVLASIADEVALGIERKRTEDALTQQAQALRESEARLRAVLSNVVEGIITINADGLIESFNPAAERIFGYSAAEVMGKHVKCLMPAPYHSAHDSYLKRYQEDGGAKTIGVEREVWGQRLDGTIFPMELGGSAVEQGGQRMFIASVRDISERRAVERLKDEFVSVVSHELRTPLTSIRGSLGLLAGGLLGVLPEKGQRMLDIAVHNTDRLVRLINDILDIERMESGKSTMEREVCDVAALMTQAGDVMQAMADKAGVRLQVTAYHTRLWADPDRIIQTLTNLLSNAIKFSPAGSTVSLSAKRQDESLLLQVTDQGRGIPAEKIDSIFERFQQVDASDRRDKGGTGLGLAICRSIVQQHGGRIWVESTLGQGSTFFCTLPVLSEAEAIATPVPSGPLVLVCDEKLCMRSATQGMLEQWGYRVATVASGEAAVEQAVSQQPAVILLDPLMPGMSAWETITALQARPATRTIPIILVSVSPPEERVSSAPDVVDWIPKPLDMTSLSQAMERALRPPHTVTRALIVEDDVDLARVLLTMFEQQGIETFHAQTGREAIQLSQRVLPDLMVLDLVMPDGDGFTVVDWLRQHDHLHQVPLVVYTAKELNAEERQRLELGHTQFLTKSRISPEEFEQRMVGLLNRVAPCNRQA